MSGFATMTAAYFDESRRRNLLQGRALAVVRDLGFILADIEKLTPEELQSQLDDVIVDLRSAIDAAEPQPQRPTSVPTVRGATVISDERRTA